MTQYKMQTDCICQYKMIDIWKKIYIWNIKAKVDQMDKNMNSPTFPSVDKDMREEKPLYAAVWDVEMAQLFWEQFENI